LAQVPGAFAPGHPSSHDWPLRTAEFYNYERFQLNANHLCAPNEEPFDRFGDMIEWDDPTVVPWEDSQVPSDYPKERRTRDRTSNRALVDPAINQVWATPRPAGAGEIAVDLQPNVADFLRFEYRGIDDSDTAGPWVPTAASVIMWRVSPSDRVMGVRGINVFGVPGPASAVGLGAP